MGLSVNTNIAALNAYRNLSSTQNDLSKSLEKLSSGLRINRAADDAAGLAISEGLRAQIGGTTQAVRNAQDGISVVQTAEGALTETHSILQRMRTLSVQASNDGGLSSTAKSNIQDEMDQLKTELTRISDTTSFNGKKLLDGSYSGNFQVGANTSAQDKIQVDLTTVVGGMGASGLGVAGVDVTKLATTNGSSSASEDIDLTSTTAPGALTVKTSATNTVTLDLADWDTTGTVEAAVKNKQLLTDKLTSAVANSELTFSIGAGTASTDAVITLNSTVEYADAAAAEAAFGLGGAAAGTVVTTEDGVALSVDGAKSAINAIDDAITTVSKVRSSLGAVQNRFDHTINNLNVAVENLTASESRIRDTDMASEMVSYTRASILSQAGTAMLAQAKNLPQSVLQLLQ